MPSDTAAVDGRAPRSGTREVSTGRKILLALAVVLVLFVAWETLTTFVAYTDDAYVRSNLVAFAPQVTGHVVGVHVRDNQAAHRNDLLISIDPVPFQLTFDARKAKLQEAQAQANAARDQVTVAQDTLQAAVAARDLAAATQRRTRALSADSFASRQTLDTATASMQRAEADVESAQAGIARAQRMVAASEAAIAVAQADLATAEWELSRTKVYAPVDGTINNLTVEVGDTARADVPLIGIVDAAAFRIVANYKQSYIRNFRVGGTAWVWLDSYPWHFFRARIQGIARGINRNETLPTLLPYVAPTTDWIRLQRRFPVTLTLEERPPGDWLFMGADARVVIFPWQD
jgi:multidrug efflux system membrane fusion protein